MLRCRLPLSGLSLLRQLISWGLPLLISAAVIVAMRSDAQGTPLCMPLWRECVMVAQHKTLTQTLKRRAWRALAASSRCCGLVAFWDGRPICQVRVAPGLPGSRRVCCNAAN